MFHPEEYGLATHERRVVFFDLDEHCISRICSAVFCVIYCVANAECVTCSAVVADHSHCVIDKGRAARWPMSLLLWGCTFGHMKRVCRRCRPISYAGFVTMLRLSAGSGAINHLPVKFRC